MSTVALNPGGSRLALRARSARKSSSSGVVVTGGGCTVSPAWCRPGSTGTVPGAGHGSTGCSQNEDGSAGGGVTMDPVVAGCSAVVAGWSSLTRPRSLAKASAASESEGSVRLDAGGGPGTSVVWTSPPADSWNPGVTSGAPWCAASGISNWTADGTAVDGYVPDGGCIGASRMAWAAGVGGVVWVDRASSGPYMKVSRRNSRDITLSIASRFLRAWLARAAPPDPAA